MVMGSLVGAPDVPALASVAEHFFVADTKGPLIDGEVDRARGWGGTLAELVAARHVSS
jgi:hypothetical protein